MSSESLNSIGEDCDEPIAATAGLLGPKMEARTEHQTTRRFNFLYASCMTLGTILVFCVFFWCIYFRGGFAWTSDPAHQFNWHPFLMVLSLVFLYAQSILVYRAGRTKPKKPLKLLHAGIHITSFVFVVIGLVAVFDSHNLAKVPIPNLYSLHSWIGLTTVIIYAYQLLAGFLSFLYPTVPSNLRAAFLPVHVSIGTVTFVLAVIAAMTGLQEKAIFALDKQYSKRVPEAYMVNFIGVMISFFGLLVLYLVSEPTYKRANLPEDQIGLTSHSE